MVVRGIASVAIISVAIVPDVSLENNENQVVIEITKAMKRQRTLEIAVLIPSI